MVEEYFKILIIVVLREMNLRRVLLTLISALTKSADTPILNFMISKQHLIMLEKRFLTTKYKAARLFWSAFMLAME